MHQDTLAAASHPSRSVPVAPGRRLRRPVVRERDKGLRCWRSRFLPRCYYTQVHSSTLNATATLEPRNKEFTMLILHPRVSSSLSRALTDTSTVKHLGEANTRQVRFPHVDSSYATKTSDTAVKSTGTRVMAELIRSPKVDTLPQPSTLRYHSTPTHCSKSAPLTAGGLWCPGWYVSRNDTDLGNVHIPMLIPFCAR